MIIDSHCHLDMLTEHDSLDNIIQRAKENGVQYLQTICTRLDNFENILSIANKYDNVYASVGVHPSEVETDKLTNAQQLLKLSENPKIIGLGETGLDYHYNKDPKQQQAQIISFTEHIKAAQENKLPVIIHTRDAEKDTLRVVSEHMKQQTFPALIHCFTASKDFAKSVLDLGLYISISGIVTFKNAAELKEIVKYVPNERLLVETDSPYLAPVPYRGKTNEPAYTKHVLQYIADLKHTNLEQMAQITTDNFYKLFNIK
ncbi:MAG: hypothetical protein DGJ47_001100 [Rickettsiaceae bacterium]